MTLRASLGVRVSVRLKLKLRLWLEGGRESA